MTCRHPSCQCEDVPVERLGLFYCSQACADAQQQQIEAIPCPCGHPECTEKWAPLTEFGG